MSPDFITAKGGGLDCALRCGGDKLAAARLRFAFASLRSAVGHAALYVQRTFPMPAPKKQSKSAA